jgi:hypothetical protein
MLPGVLHRLFLRPTPLITAATVRGNASEDRIEERSAHVEAGHN